METHSSVLAWRIPGMGETGGLPSMGSHRVGHNWSDLAAAAAAEHSLALPFFGIGMKTDFFQSCGHCWVFQICWHIECSTFTVSSFRIWNSSTGIPSPSLALFIVMLSKAHLTSHSRVSGSRSVITPSWLSGLWRSFLYRRTYFLGSAQSGWIRVSGDGIKTKIKQTTLTYIQTRTHIRRF